MVLIILDDGAPSSPSNDHDEHEHEHKDHENDSSQKDHMNGGNNNDNSSNDDDDDDDDEEDIDMGPNGNTPPNKQSKNGLNNFGVYRDSPRPIFPNHKPSKELKLPVKKKIMMNLIYCIMLIQD